MFTKKLIVLLSVFVVNAFAADKITAQSWLVATESGRIIHGANIDKQRSIASITKLMTAMIVIDAGQNPQEKIGNYTREQHIQLALVNSNNQSAILLCENYPGGKTRCIRDMNLKAASIGMKNTKFVEASGLSPMNISTGRDLLELVLSASYYPQIREAGKTPQVKIQIRKKLFFFNNTNPSIGKQHEFIVSKTGWTKAAGGCIVVYLKTEVGNRVVIVLGSKNTKTRIPEAEFISTMKEITY